MKEVIENYPSEVYISAAELERTNLNEWERLELHLLDQAAVVIPGVMTVMELVRTAEALQGLASDLLTALGTACEKCDGCQVELLCDLMKGTDRPQITIPAHVLEESGLDADCKLACTAGPKNGAVHVVEADHRYDLTDLPAELLDIFREIGICLGDLEEKLMAEGPVYGGVS